jgi:hypothetical protein
MTAQGYVVREMILTLDDGAGGTVDVSCAVTGVDHDPGESVTTWQTACPDGAAADVVKGPESLSVSYALDYRSPDTLARILDVRSGQRAVATFAPDAVNAPDYLLTGEVVLSRGSRSHTVGQTATATATWSVLGDGMVPATPPAPPATVGAD